MAKKVNLNLGCGVHLFKDFLNVDIFSWEDLNSKIGDYAQAEIEPGAKYVQADICKLPFKDNFADYIEMIDVIEHQPRRNVIPALAEIYRVLKKNGEFVMLTTNFNNLAKLWLEYITKPEEEKRELNLNTYFMLESIIYGRQTKPGEFHQSMFTPAYMAHCMQKAGWKKVEIRIYPVNTPSPKFKGAVYGKNSYNLTDNLYVKAKK